MEGILRFGWSYKLEYLSRGRVLLWHPRSFFGHRTLVRGDTPVRSHDLKTSVSWTISMLDDAMVKLSQLMEAQRPRDLEELNKMKRASWTKCLAARRCKQEAQPARRSLVGAQVESRTSGSGLGGYRAVLLAKDGYGQVDSSGQAMGMGNPCGLQFDMSRSG
ncbi:hypothetical protein F2Q69_00053750 [Brassica cretica]|uniref:Uncharacterized protein n=1 Tax=Brassica cretica TaxID=69181 RepID=A0A8S9MUM7_BRACR|nr:hypothetical protein F2Q69_00053750 [Brassica cretica]